MFSRRDLVLAITLSLVGGYAYGYTKAREKFVEVLAKASLEKMVKDEEKKES